MRILYFGTWEKNYSRNQVIIKGLKSNKVDVKECHVSTIWNRNVHKTKLSKFMFFLDVIKSYISLTYKHMFKVKDYDIMICGYPGWIDVPLARLLTKKKIVFDAFFSLYDSVVEDRGLFNKNGLIAKFLFFLDKYCCKKADIVLLDTNEHIKYFTNTFKIPSSKFRKIFVGAEEDIFYPRKKIENDKIKVIFYGKFVPLQGIEYIIKAARLLEKHKDIEFEIIGGGQLKEKIVRLAKGLKNVKFIGFLPIEKLAERLSQADIGLGVFGNTSKAKRVIPNKAYHVLAMKIPLITQNSPAAREALIHMKDCVLCKAGDEKAIAKSILLLKKNKKLKDKIAENGYNLFKKKFDTKAIGKQLLMDLKWT